MSGLPLRIIVGLGNPGPEYERTRHNAGWMAIDRLARRHAPPPGQTPRGRFSAVTWEAIIGGQKCLLMKPTTFMNRSGRSVAEAVGFYKADPAQDLMVLVDDLALPLDLEEIQADDRRADEREPKGPRREEGHASSLPCSSTPRRKSSNATSVCAWSKPIAYFIEYCRRSRPCCSNALR